MNFDNLIAFLTEILISCCLLYEIIYVAIVRIRPNLAEAWFPELRSGEARSASGLGRAPRSRLSLLTTVIG